MSAQAIFVALALVCIIEGIVPLIAPKKWLETVREISQTATEYQVRKIGLALFILAWFLLSIA